MSGLRKTLLTVGAAASVAILAFVETPFAQSNVTVGKNASQQFRGTQAPADAVPALADEKAEAAMTAGSNPAPTTDADRKAAAAMSK
jgi:hypothetical protein